MGCAKNVLLQCTTFYYESVLSAPCLMGFFPPPLSLYRPSIGWILAFKTLFSAQSRKEDHIERAHHLLTLSSLDAALRTSSPDIYTNSASLIFRQAKRENSWQKTKQVGSSGTASKGKFTHPQLSFVDQPLQRCLLLSLEF